MEADAEEAADKAVAEQAAPSLFEHAAASVFSLLEKAALVSRGTRDRQVEGLPDGALRSGVVLGHGGSAPSIPSSAARWIVLVSKTKPEPILPLSVATVYSERTKASK